VKTVFILSNIFEELFVTHIYLSNSHHNGIKVAKNSL
jgi:hypothetical protein